MKATDCEHGNPWDECGECAIAAAEERGRRAGIEGVDKLRSEAEAGLADALNAEMKYRRLRDDQTANFHAGRGCVYRWAIPMLAALAPRDSGPVCKCSGTSSAVFYDGGHLPDCPVIAPSKDRK